MSNGAPTLLNGAAPSAPAPISSDTAASNGQSAAPTWGIYLGGVLALQPDSIVSTDYHREWVLADYPIEGGTFGTYDKVAKPFDIRVRMTKGGTDADRAAFLAAVESIGASVQLYDVVTPEFSYVSVNVSTLASTRSNANGMGLVTVDIGLRQIRLDASATTGIPASQAQSPGAASPQNGGTVQTKAPTAAQTAAAQAALMRQANLPLMALMGQLK